MPDEEWARRSQAHLTPIRVGRIVVSPPWHATPHPSSYILEPAPLEIRHSADLVIVIDPSTGFGTGHHETTRLCLSLLQAFELAGRGVIDVGTGSGVLAIAAAKLGASSVVAFDEDPEALRNARENVARNDVSSRVDVQEAELGTFRGKAADVVVANLTGAVIQKYARRLAALVSPGGRLIVSGFSVAEAVPVTGALAGVVEQELSEGDWAALASERGASHTEPIGYGVTADRPLAAGCQVRADRSSRLRALRLRGASPCDRDYIVERKVHQRNRDQTHGIRAQRH